MKADDKATNPRRQAAWARGLGLVNLRRLAAISLLGLVATTAQAWSRSWTCHATIFVSGTAQQYTPSSWKMKTGDPHTADRLPGDREKSCKNYITAVFLKGDIWKRFSFTAEEQAAICKNNSGDFRIEYGFDRRRKSWQFTKILGAPPCDCELACRAGYDLDDGSSSGPRCVRKLCETTGIADQRLGSHDNGLGVWHGGIYHHQPVAINSCRFRSNSGSSGGSWTSWLNRDRPSGSGDYETLSEHVKDGKACAKPEKVECETVDGKSWKDAGQNYLCSPERGGVCRNKGQYCFDYRVRFYCS